MCANIWRLYVWLAQTENYLAGDRPTYADLAAAAHLFGESIIWANVPWNEDKQQGVVRAGHILPSFRRALSECWRAAASRTYVDLDF